MTSYKPEEYLSNLDSLARFYNSQMLAHAGYLITIIGIVAGGFLTLLSSVVIPQWTTGGVYVLALMIVITAIVVLGDFFLLSFPYLFARLQFYVAFSWIVWAHMSMTEAPTGLWTRNLRKRAKRVGIQNAVRDLFEAQLFVSRCLRGKRIRKGDRCLKVQMKHDDLRITQNLSAFGFSLKESGTIMQRPPYYDAPAPVLGRLGFRQVDLLYLAYKRTIKTYLKTDIDSCNHEHLKRGRLLELIFESDCPKCKKRILENWTLDKTAAAQSKPQDPQQPSA